MLLLLLACLGLYGLVININPARLQLYLQSIQLEVKDDTVVADVDDNDGDATSSPTYYPTSSTTTAESSSDSKAGDAGVVDGATMATSSPTYYPSSSTTDSPSNSRASSTVIEEENNTSSDKPSNNESKILGRAKPINSSLSAKEPSYSEASSNLTNNHQTAFATRGAKEWHKIWMLASRKGKEQKTDNSQYSSRDDFVALQL